MASYSDSPPPAPDHLLRLFKASAAGALERVRACLAMDALQADRAAVMMHINGFNTLHSAARKGHCAVVDELVTFYPPLLQSRTSDGRTAFMLASQEGKLDTLKKLLSFSSNSLEDIMSKDGSGNSILHMASWSGAHEVVKFLVDELNVPDAVLAAVNNEGLSAQQLAAAKNHVEILKLLTSRRITARSLSVAKEGARESTSEPVADLQSSSLPSTTEVALTMTPLGFSEVHRSAMYGSLDALRFLLINTSTVSRCDILTCRSENGSSPLHLAAEHGHTDVVAALIEEFNTDVDPLNDSSLTPLMTACFHGRTEVVQRLLACGADPTLCSVDGSTSVGLAASEGHDEVVEALARAISAKLDPGAAAECWKRKDSKGRSPAELAIHNGHKSTAALIDSLTQSMASTTIGSTSSSI